ncbi:MAG: energy transducer TonB [Burkholderiales bacterium]
MQQFAPLLLALGLSALAHLSILYGLKLNAPGDAPSVGEVLHARLQSLEPTPLQEFAGPPPRKKALSRLAVGPFALTPQPEPEPQAPVHSSLPPQPAEGEGAPVPLLADATIYTPRELDVFPKPVVSIQPLFPQRAREDLVSGGVTLELLINQQGAVEEAKVLEASPEGYFEEAALESFKAARFAPGYRDGIPVRSRLAVKVDFELGRSASANDVNR